MAFGPNTVIRPDYLPFKNPPSAVVDDRGEFIDNEVCGMNQDYQKEKRFWVAEHQ